MPYRHLNQLRKLLLLLVCAFLILSGCKSADLSSYAFPEKINPSTHYLFYLHGKIVEDQGLKAVSPEYGEYQYKEILKKLGSTGQVVISEQRPKDADPLEYAQITSGQVTSLLKAGVPPGNITVVGASKGAGIAIFVSNLLANEQINYVLLAICDPLTVDFLAQGGIALYGNVLSIYDETDSYAGSCENLFSASAGYGLEKYEEIVLHLGKGHGILYQPYDEWLLPTLEWAAKP
jgi:hypothetical protein